MAGVDPLRRGNSKGATAPLPWRSSEPKVRAPAPSPSYATSLSDFSQSPMTGHGAKGNGPRADLITFSPETSPEKAQAPGQGSSIGSGKDGAKRAVMNSATQGSPNLIQLEDDSPPHMRTSMGGAHRAPRTVSTTAWPDDAGQRENAGFSRTISAGAWAAAAGGGGRGGGGPAGDGSGSVGPKIPRTVSSDAWAEAMAEGGGASQGLSTIPDLQAHPPSSKDEPFSTPGHRLHYPALGLRPCMGGIGSPRADARSQEPAPERGAGGAQGVGGGSAGSGGRPGWEGVVGPWAPRILPTISTTSTTALISKDVEGGESPPHEAAQDAQTRARRQRYCLAALAALIGLLIMGLIGIGLALVLGTDLVLPKYREAASSQYTAPAPAPAVYKYNYTWPPFPPFGGSAPQFSSGNADGPNAAYAPVGTVAEPPAANATSPAATATSPAATATSDPPAASAPLGGVGAGATKLPPPQPVRRPPPRAPPRMTVRRAPRKSAQPLNQTYDFDALDSQPSQDRYMPCSDKGDNTDRGPWSIKITGQPLGHVWKGWGTSLVWWPRFLYEYPADQYKTLMDLVFDPDVGLGMNIVRYSIPASYNPEKSPRVAASTYQSQGFRPDPKKEYDWSQDRRQIKTMIDAKAYGVNIFEAISYSPPWWMTITGDVAGAYDGRNNFMSRYAPDFAEYLADVIHRFQNDPKINVSFSSIGPFNEALEGWWYAGRDKEGCDFTLDDMSNIILELRGKLRERNLTTKISALDSWTQWTGKAFGGSSEGQLSPEAIDAVDVIAIHGYLTPKPEQDAYDRDTYGWAADIAASLGKEMWQTEWGPLGYRGSEIQWAILMARVICQHVNYLKVSTWQLWQVIQQRNGGGWGALQVPYRIFRDYLRVHITKTFYALKQIVSRFRPGSIPVKVEDSCQAGVVAAYNVEERYLQATVVNQQYRDFNMTLDFLDYAYACSDPVGLSRIDVVRTSQLEDNELIDSYFAPMPGKLALVSSGLTVTTIVVHCVRPVVKT